MKITLVNPNQLNPYNEYSIDGARQIVGRISPSIAMGSLAASLPAGHELAIVEHLTSFMTGESLEDLAKRHFSESDVVGINFMTNTREYSVRLSEIAQSLGSLVIGGGPHATLLPKQLLDNYPIDIVCIGEAETTFPALIHALDTNREVKQVAGIAYKKHDDVVFTRPAVLADNLDRLRYPDYSAYFDLGDVKTTSIMTSRGCPYKCNFCTSGYIDKSVRSRSVDDVVGEIKSLAGMGVKHIQFEDYTLTLNPRQSKILFKKLVQERMGLTLNMITRLNTFDDELIGLFKEAGGKGIEAAIETGSEQLRQKMNKQLSDNDIYKGVETLKKHNVQLNLYVMLGYPSESDADRRATYEMLRNIKPDGLLCSIYHLNPGSRVYHNAVHEGRISKESFLQLDKQYFYWFEGDELKKIEDMQNTILKDFGPMQRPETTLMMAKNSKESYNKLT